MQRQLESAVQQGVSFLHARQLPSGQFPINATFYGQQQETPDQSVFATTHIVYSLGFVPGDTAKTMIQQALGYFKAEMTGRGLWRHWNRDAEWCGRKIFDFIPADLDDTAGVSFLMERHGADFPDNRPLFLLNRNCKGLFYTWLMLRPKATLQTSYWWEMLRELRLDRSTAFFITTPAAYRDVDAVVNANVLLYLGPRPETQAITNWLIRLVHAGQEDGSDKYYRGLFSFCYALSRSYLAGASELGTVSSLIVERLRAACDSSGQIGANALQTALAINTLLNLGVEASDLIDNALRWLLRAQALNGSWPTAPYYYGGPNQEAVTWGSPELTTGLALEAIARCSARLSEATTVQDMGSREEACVA